MNNNEAISKLWGSLVDIQNYLVTGMILDVGAYYTNMLKGGESEMPLSHSNPIEDAYSVLEYTAPFIHEDLTKVANMCIDSASDEYKEFMEIYKAILAVAEPSEVKMLYKKSIIKAYANYQLHISVFKEVFPRYINEEEKTVVNNVTLNFGDGASFTGPLAVGENIRVSYNAVADIEEQDIRDSLQEVVKQVSDLAQAIELEDLKNDVSEQLKAFVTEAKKEKPSRWMLDISSKGLLEAAKTVASLTDPVSKAVKAVLEMISPHT